MCFLDQMASLCWWRVPKSHISVLPNDGTFSWSPKPPKFFQLKKSYRTPKNSSENHGKSHQSFREDKGNEIIWVPLINNLRQPKKYLYKHIYKQEKKSHIPQMLSDSATSWGHRRRIKAFTAYRSACTSRGHSGRPFWERKPLCLVEYWATAPCCFWDFTVLTVPFHPTADTQYTPSAGAVTCTTCCAGCAFCFPVSSF